VHIYRVLVIKDNPYVSSSGTKKTVLQDFPSPGKNRKEKLEPFRLYFTQIQYKGASLRVF
jgi:hypothetical protein